MAVGVSYLGTNYGTTMAIPYAVGGNTRINFFSFRLGRVLQGHVNQGQTITTSATRVVRGAIWNSQPSSPTSSPNYLSTNAVDVASCYTLPKNAAGNAADLTLCRFNFNNVVVGSSNIWIGLYTDYPSNTALCFARNDAYGDLLYNQLTSWTFWSGRGLNVYEMSNQTPVVAPGAPTNLNMSPRLIENQNYTLSWNAPANSGNNAATGYRLYWGNSAMANVSGTSYTTNHIGGAARGQTITWRVVATNSAGEGGSASVSGRRNQVPTAPTSLILNGGNTDIQKGTNFAITATGSTPPTADASSPYNDSIARYEVQYRRRVVDGTWGSWMNLKNASGAAAYSFAANSGGNLSISVPVPSDVAYGDQMQIRVYAVDSLGAKSVAATSSVTLQSLWQNIRYYNGSTWILGNMYVRSGGVWKLCPVYRRSASAWTLVSSG